MRPRFAAAVLLLAAGCSTSTAFTSSRATMPGMPCTEATRAARGALLRLGYESEVVTAPQAGAPGTVVGHKAGGYDYVTHAATRQYTATVTITCSNAGATLEAVTDEPLPGSLTFKGDFARMAEAVAARRIQRPRLASQPETGMVISVEPLRGSEARNALGDLRADGITPVRIRLDNHSERTYAFSSTRVRLESQEGGRVTPLSDGEVAARGGGAGQAVVDEKRIRDATLAPNAVVTGFLYFPAAAYRRATIVLIDLETEEDEGFSVEF